MNDYLILSAYGSHNGTISTYYNGEYTVVEVERWINSKNAGITTYLPISNPQLVFDEICNWLLAKAGKTEVDVYIPAYLTKEVIPKFNCKKTVYINHHDSHAAAAFYQSPFQKSLVISYDGGGDGDYFNFYEADKFNGVKLVGRLSNDLGFPYMILAHFLDDIKQDGLSIGNLVYAGKLMGLCSYGNVREDWLPHFLDYYRKYVYSGEAFLGGLEVSQVAVEDLFKAIGLWSESFNFDHTRFSGQNAWDIAATTQKAFEEIFLELAHPYLEKYSNLPLCISGGCGLNVLLNAKLLEIKNGNVFVPPNTSDCGISVGSILHHLAPTKQVDLTYSGIPILDDLMLSTYTQDTYKYTTYSDVTVDELAEYISNGKIVGLIQGNSEHGSRALGNRSIICDPSGDMKDILNKKVKDREWYRPFAPIVRLEDANKYFHYDYNVESRHMTFVANVRDEWKEVLPAITHTDGTARLQTVTREQNPLIYDLITKFGELSGHSVILNTSFNVNGKPILSRLTDAFEILDTTELDAIYYKGNLIMRRENDRHFSRSVKYTSQGKRTGISLYGFGIARNSEEDGIIRDNLEILSEFENSVLVTDAEGVKYYPQYDNVNVYEVEPRHVYMKPYHNKENVKDAFDKIRLLWAKEVLNDDHYFTAYGVFVDLAKFDPNTFRKELNNLITLSVNKDNLILSGKRDYTNEVFTSSWQQENNCVFDDLLHPTVKFFGGTRENIEKLSNRWEAVYMWNNNKKLCSGSDEDYLIPALVDSGISYKIFEE